MYHLCEAIKALRLAEERRQQDQPGGEGAVGAVELWRGVRNRGVDDDFFSRGGVERAFASTTTTREVAEEYATKDGARSSLLFKVVVPHFMSNGADISFLSCFPEENEVRHMCM